MKTKKWLVIIILLVAVTTAGATEKRIMQISKDGTSVTFEDGSVYRIDPSAATRTFKWLVGDSVRIPDGKRDEWFRVPIGDPSAGYAVPGTRIK
ncbi:MAG: hypothetical protein ACLP5H_28915 [Desulfomonilaceae bacterium]